MSPINVKRVLPLVAYAAAGSLPALSSRRICISINNESIGSKGLQP